MINAPFTHCAGCCHYYNGICNSLDKCPYQVGVCYSTVSNEDLVKIDMGSVLYKEKEKTVEQVVQLVKEAVFDYCSDFVGGAVWRAIVRHLDDNGIEVEDE